MGTGSSLGVGQLGFGLQDISFLLLLRALQLVLSHVVTENRFALDASRFH